MTLIVLFSKMENSRFGKVNTKLFLTIDEKLMYPMKSNHKLLLKIFVVLAYLSMVTVNYLANALKIGGVTTGEASDSYANLFTPAGLTFSIWGLIYLMLAVFIVFFCMQFGKKSDSKRNVLLDKIGKLFIINALANISWLFAWHYGLVPVSVVIMIILLGTLIMIANLLNKEQLSLLEHVWLQTPFSIYFGWITVATIVNITVLLVSLNWSGFGFSENVWTIIIAIVGATIGIWRAFKDKNIAYVLVLIWAYSGIWLKHSSEHGFSNQFPNIMTTLIICIVFFLITAIWLSFHRIKKLKTIE